MKRLTRITLLATILSTAAHAGRYPASGTQAFPYADNTINLGDGTTLSSSFPTSFAKVTGNPTIPPPPPYDGYLQLANKTFSGNTTVWKIPNLDVGAAVQSFDASFLVRMNRSTTSAPGAGFSLNFGPIPASGNGSGDLGFTMAGGMVISFDTYANTANDFPSIQIICNNTPVGEFLSSDFTETTTITSGTFTLTNPVNGQTTAAIQWNASAGSVQTAMRAVDGWKPAAGYVGVLVTGTAGNWTVNHNVVGSYADPVANPALLANTTTMAPGMAKMTITNTQDGTAAQNEIWTIGGLQGRGFVYGNTFKPVTIHWDYDGLDLSYNGQVIFTNLPTPGFSPSSGNTFAWCAAAAGGSHDTFIDDVVLSTAPAVPFDTGGPVISEFMAENSSTLEDEDLDTPDWIEIYNAQNASLNLNGYKLTNGAATWVFPSVTLGAYTHLVVYASGKNRTANPALLHTNFTLLKTGGTLSLLSPADAVLSTYTYPNQTENVSFGVKYQGGATGFIDTVSVNAPTLYSYIVAANGPTEDVIFSRNGGIITGSTPLSVTAPVAPGSVVRYTTDNTNPTEASPIFPATLDVTATTNVRARVFTPGFLPGPVSSRTFLLIDASLSNYNSSGQPFKSHLPLIVFDSFGINVDGVTDQSQPRPHRYTYGVVIDKDAGGYASITSPTYSYQGRGGTHVAGDSSGGFPQKSYSWETWNNDDQDKDEAILGMPAESDWRLHGPYTDKTFIRNFIAYSKMREVRGEVDGHGMRTRLVEVIYNQDAVGGVPTPISYTDYRGVYVLMERIKVANNRVDISKLNSLATDPTLITGGYIFRRDRLSADGNTGLPVGMHSHTPNILNSAQTTYLTNRINAFNNALNGGTFTDPVTGYAPYIDVDSFIYQWWFVEICKQIDGYRLSTYFYKDRGANAKIVAGPIWDFNLSLGNADYLAGDQPTGWYWNQTDSYWWARLRQDPNYETRNWDIYWEMRRGIWATPSINAYIDGLASQALNGSTTPVTNNMSLAAGQPSTLENSVMRHYREFPILGTYVWPNASGVASRIYYNSNGNATTGEIDWMKNWLSTRMVWLDDQYTNGGFIYRPPNFSNYGGNVPSGTTLTISPYTGTPPGGFAYAPLGTIYYTTDGTDPRPSSTGGSPGEIDLISGTANACQWLVPSAANGGNILTAGAGAQQWTNYTDPANIANWTNGNTGVGYDNNPDYLPLISSNTGTQMFNINATCYVRVAFNIPDAATLANIATLRLHMKYDDGHRTYLNGVQVGGSNDTHASMTTDPSTANATIARDEAAAVAFETTDITGTGIPALRVGLNVLAIHCLNGVDFTSSDLLMVPRLTYLPPGAGGGGGNGTVYSGPITINSSQTVKARLQYNGFWSPITTADYVVNAVPATAANIVITEVMYNPSAATPGEVTAGYGDNDFEYIELQNVSGGAVDLTGCNFITGVTFDFDVADPGTLTLPAGARIIVVANSAAFTARYGVIPGLRTAGQFAGSLSNSGETLTLTNAVGAIIAQFTYGTGEPWPVAADGAGYSLVLNNPATGAAYGSAASWRSSAALGGTPGTTNSTPFTGSLSGDTDGDGFSDFLEHGLGSDWNANASHHMPQASLAPYTVGGIPGTYFRFYHRRGLAADGVTHSVEATENMTAWTTPVTYVGTVNNGDGTATVEYRSTNPVTGANPRMAMRVRMSSAP